VALARDLVNRPGGALSATELADAAVAVTDSSPFLSAEVWDRARCEQERLGGLLGVNAGSADEPRLVHLTWDPPGLPEASTVALVGKGITFDSGGLSLKTADGMKRMKTDMAGAAALIGTMAALPTVSPVVRVDAWIASTDNMLSATSMKVGDVLTIRNGTTVEVLNTDAEGRLVLADALSLAAEQEPDVILDLATLTGACVAALGPRIAGVMGNDEAVIDAVRVAAAAAGEEVWPLPLPKAYRPELDSKIADLRNIGEGHRGGALKAGLFLGEFVAGLPWAHLDVAGPVFDEEDGATGFGVRLLVEFLSGDGD
jgi:leucyl aminopeptidase